MIGNQFILIVILILVIPYLFTWLGISLTLRIKSLQGFNVIVGSRVLVPSVLFLSSRTLELRSLFWRWSDKVTTFHLKPSIDKHNNLRTKCVPHSEYFFSQNVSLISKHSSVFFSIP